jgi:hypothetical protein
LAFILQPFLSPRQTPSNPVKPLSDHASPRQLSPISPIKPVRSQSAIRNPQSAIPVKPGQTIFQTLSLAGLAAGATLYCGFSGAMHNLWYLASQSAIRNPHLPSNPVKPSQTILEEVKNRYFVAFPSPFRKSRHLGFGCPLAFHYSLFTISPGQTQSNRFSTLTAHHSITPSSQFTIHNSHATL